MPVAAFTWQKFVAKFKKTVFRPTTGLDVVIGRGVNVVLKQTKALGEKIPDLSGIS